MSISIKVPVEYTIISTSDWTRFEIIEGGSWQDLQVECKVGKDKLKKEIYVDNKTIYLEKESYDETLVVVTAKGFLNINKEYRQSNIAYKITKGEIQSTIILISANRRKLNPLLNNKSTIFDGKNPEIFFSPSEDYLRDLTKEKVFIIYGREKMQALLLKDYLRKLKVDAIMFDDLRDEGKTIFQKINDINNNISYAFAILTPDDIGCLKIDIDKFTEKRKAFSKEALNKILENRARQNVLFELGLFIGALGKENICYLKQKDLKEIPSDLDGVLYKEFEKSVEEAFHKLREELFPTE